MKTSQKLKMTCLGAAIALVATGCHSNKTSAESSMYSASSVDQPKAVAVARLNPTQGNHVQGTVFFSKETEGIRVTGDITGLTPGKHGFHIHEKGDCSAPDGSSAGGHYNPTGMPHGGPKDVEQHVGDLGNITANSEGVAKFAYTVKWFRLTGENSIIGRAVIVHAQADDLKSQPSGNAGPRVACGVIEKQ